MARVRTIKSPRQPSARKLVAKVKEKVEKATQRSPWRSLTNARVYTAEQYGCSVSDAVLGDFDDVRVFLQDIRRSKVWRAKWGRTPLRVKHRSRGASFALGGTFYARSFRERQGKRKVMYRTEPIIQLPFNRFGRSVHIIVHEMAHALAACPGHGPKFCRALLALVAEFEGKYYARALRKRLIQTGALPRPRKRS